MRAASWWARWRQATAWSSRRRPAPRRRSPSGRGSWRCLLEKGGKFLLAERTTNIVLELQGSDLERQLGNQVEISGRAVPASPGTPAGSQLIKVAGIKLVSKGGCTAIAKKLGAATVAAGAAGAGAT